MAFSDLVPFFSLIFAYIHFGMHFHHTAPLRVKDDLFRLVLSGRKLNQLTQFDISKGCYVSWHSLILKASSFLSSPEISNLVSLHLEGRGGKQCFPFLKIDFWGYRIFMLPNILKRLISFLSGKQVTHMFSVWNNWKPKTWALEFWNRFILQCYSN